MTKHTHTQILAKIRAAAHNNTAHTLLYAGEEWSTEFEQTLKKACADLGMAIPATGYVPDGSTLTVEEHQFVIRRFEREHGGGQVALVAADEGTRRAHRDPMELWKTGLKARNIEMKVPTPPDTNDSHYTFYAGEE